MELVFDPQTVKAVFTLTDLGMNSTEIADAIGISRHTVMKVQRYNQITPAHRPNGVTVSAGPSRAELVAAAKPWVQRPWSAKDAS